MTLDQLRIFVAVAEGQHMTRAAEQLHLAQSAVSHAIGVLEAQSGTLLFNRVGRRIELTEAGTALLREARLVLAQAERAEAVLDAFGSLNRGTLSVAASLTISGYWLPRHLARFRQRHAAVAVRLTVGNTRQVAEAVESGGVELGLVEGEIAPGPFHVAPVARDQLVVVVPPGHSWARHSPGNAEMLVHDWVLREAGSGTRSVFEAALRQRGVDPNALRVVLDLPSNEAVRGAVEAGLGATAISASVAASSLEAGLLEQAKIDLPERQFLLLRHQQRPLTPAARAFLEIIGVG